MNDSRPRDLTQEELTLSLSVSGNAGQTAPTATPPTMETASAAPSPAPSATVASQMEASTGDSIPTMPSPE